MKIAISELEHLRQEVKNCHQIIKDLQKKRPWVGLTDREIDELWMSHHDDFGNPLSATGYERAIEAKLKERNGY